MNSVHQQLENLRLMLGDEQAAHPLTSPDPEHLRSRLVCLHTVVHHLISLVAEHIGAPE